MSRVRILCWVGAAVLCYASVRAEVVWDLVQGGCACELDTQLDPGCSFWTAECRWIPLGPPTVDLGDPNQAMVDELDCNNCNGCDPMTCIQQLCVTVTDEVSVSGTAGFSVEMNAEINAMIGAELGIQMTTEFQKGFTSSTTVATEYCVQCGSSSVAPCHHPRYLLTSYSTPGDGTLPLGHQWYARCVGEGEEEWLLKLNKCPGQAGSVPFSGSVGSASGCVAQEQGCDACPPCGGPGGPDT